MYKLSKAMIALGLLLVLIAFAHAVWEKEQLLKTGEQAFIKLAPVDPRSLMQGDYMILNYDIPADIETTARQLGQGLLVYRRNDQYEVTLLRVADDNENRDGLQQGERYMQFRYRDRGIQLGANSFFFQEGKAEHFEQAKFGEVRIAQDGNVILVGLRDEKHQLLGMSSGLQGD